MKNSIQLLWEKFRKNRRFNETVRCLIPAAVYGVIYLTWFFHLEDSKALHYTEIHTALDDKIPFLEIFVIPYFGWFIYCAFFFFYFLLKHDIEDYFKNAAFFFSGMTLFLIISSLWPNIQYLRPAVMPRDNIFTAMVAHLYLTDTPTNLWPSIHVYNAIGTHIAIANSRRLGRIRKIRISSLIFCILIILSTMFIKQHSIIDVLGGILFAIVANLIVYKSEIIVNAYRRYQKRASARRAM